MAKSCKWQLQQCVWNSSCINKNQICWPAKQELECTIMPPDHQWHYLTRWEEFLGGESSRMRAIKEVKVSSEIQQWIRLCIVRQLSLLVEYGKDMSFFLHELLVKTLTLWTNRFLKWRSTWDRRSKTKYLPMFSISDFFMV